MAMTETHAIEGLHDLDFMEGKQILLVDDEDDIRSSLTRLITGTLPGVSVVSYATGEEGIEALGGVRFDAVIADYRLPGKNGLEVLAAARRRDASMPRLLISAFTDLELALAAINEARVESVLTKPVDTKVLVQTLNDLLVERHMAE